VYLFARDEGTVDLDELRKRLRKMSDEALLREQVVSAGVRDSVGGSTGRMEKVAFDNGRRSPSVRTRPSQGRNPGSIPGIAMNPIGSATEFSRLLFFFGPGQREMEKRSQLFISL
jgi:hypothetical protein